MFWETALEAGETVRAPDFLLLTERVFLLSLTGCIGCAVLCDLVWLEKAV